MYRRRERVAGSAEGAKVCRRYWLDAPLTLAGLPASTTRTCPVSRSCYPARMTRAYWQRELEEAERELDAATRLSDTKAAAGRLQRAKAALKELDAEPAKPPKRPNRGRGA
jgi:hypothetical protein